MGRLLDTLWGHKPPTSASTTLHTHVLRLRRVLRERGLTSCPVRTVPGGYLLEATEDTLDLLSFRRQVAQARRYAGTGDHESELRHLGWALDLWRGQALTNIQSEVLQREEAPQLAEERLAVVQRRVDVALALGRHDDLVPELRSLTDAHPLRERFWEQLVEVLYRLGRQADALEECRRIKSILADELGIDPGPDLRRLELQILRGERTSGGRAGTRPQPVSVRPSAPGQFELPPDVTGLIGRADLTAEIAGDLAAWRDRPAPAVAVLRGLPGVGKTALAVHIAHQLRPHFPEGQWYVQLADPHGVARDADQVIRQLRAALAGRRILLLLDGATSVAHVQRLLPGTAGGGVLVTSRMSLAGLTALWGSPAYLVDALPPADSVDLLAHMLSAEMVRAEPAATSKLASLCGGLPLALRIAAAKFLDRWPHGLASYVSWLRHDTLSKLCLGTDRCFSVRDAFEESYTGLSPGGQRLLMRLAAGPGRDAIRDEVAVPANGHGDHRDEALLEELLDRSMIRLVAPGAYAMQPLLRRYLVGRAREPGAGPGQEAGAATS